MPLRRDRSDLYGKVVLKPIPVPPPVTIGTCQSAGGSLNEHHVRFHPPTTTQFLRVIKEAAVREGVML